MTTIPPRTLSSAMTFLMKFIFPTLWISIFGYGTLALWTTLLQGHDNQAPPVGMKGVFLLMWVAGTLFILKFCAGLKCIKADNRNLYISNYLREITVPLTLIENVTEIRWINIHPVTIHFRGDTEFGQRVTFMPQSRIFAGGSHPVVTELNVLAKHAQGH
jgi:hypothetical protein